MSFSQQPSKQKPLLILSGVVATVACVLLGSYLFKTEAQPYEYVPASAKRLGDGDFAKKQAESIVRAKEMRDVLHVWAQQHPALLTRMRQKPGDETVFSKLLEVLPRDIGSINPEGHRKITRADLTSGTVEFTWQPDVLAPMTLPTAAEQSGWDRNVQTAIAHMRKQFAETGDIKLSEALVPGPDSVALWASGRITTEKAYTATEGGMYVNKETYTEIVPPFTF